MNYPGQLIPISGAPSTENIYDPVPGSAASLLLRWTPITFGRRSAFVEYNRKLYDKLLAAVDDEVLRTKSRVILLYLEIAATNELIKSYDKNIERNEFNLFQVATLVNSGLRPAVDSLKFMGELSKSSIELYHLRNILESQKQLLFELLVSEDLNDDLYIDSSFFYNLPVVRIAQMEPDSAENPSLKMARMDFEAEQKKLKAISRSWLPRLEFWGTTYARGSGISYDETVNKADGWSFNRYNYGAGLQIVFPLIDLANVKLRSSHQEWITRASESNLRQTQIVLTRQENIARNDLETALQIAAEVPVEYRANETAFSAFQRRYNEGLIDYTELIQAQYDLLNAEVRMKNVYLMAWQALLKLAVVKGDINFFLNQIPD
jgi:outer membrane protein